VPSHLPLPPPPPPPPPLPLPPPSASVDDVKLFAVILNHTRCPLTALDAAGYTPLHVALQHGCSAVACFIVTRSPPTLSLTAPDTNQPTIVAAITHWHCSSQFISACITSDASLLFKLFNGSDLCAWSISAGRHDIANLLKRNQATLRALTGSHVRTGSHERTGSQEEQKKESGVKNSTLTLKNSYSLKKAGELM
jgi:ankyrin repeat protein